MRRVQSAVPATGGLRQHLLAYRVDRFERDYGRGFECDENAGVRHVDRGEDCPACAWPTHRFWRDLLGRMDQAARDIDALRHRTGPVAFQACEVRLDGLLPHPPRSGWWWYVLAPDDALTAYRGRP